MNKQEQIGGEDYQSEIQPVDYIAANNLDFFEGNVVKYITRWRKKNGLEDLKKAAWYIKYLIDAEETKNLLENTKV